MSVTLDGQIGPTLQADKNGCVAIAITYVGNTQFTVTGSTIRYTLQEGQNQAVLTGTGTDGGPLVTAVNFDLHTIPTTGNAASIKGKGIPLSWAVIAGAIVDALLLGSGALLRYRYGQMAKNGGFMAGAGDNDDDEEEPFDNQDFGGADEFFNQSEPAGELPTPT